MSFSNIIQNGLDFTNSNLLLSAAVAIVVLYLFIKSPKTVLTLFVIAIAAMGVMHLLDKLSPTGLSGAIK